MTKTCELCNSTPAVVVKDGHDMCEACRQCVVLEDLEDMQEELEEDKRRKEEFEAYLNGISSEKQYLSRLRQALKGRKDDIPRALGRFAAETQRRMDAGTDEQFLKSCGIKA